ncbi:MAG TPA: aminodeoxychorismate/anthranilate synthase component II [Candidatus Dormibacteraeota bacterium]|nr:aminodeoxychorismate/anthranilate synthase component II [Candidatus Dormibacteraeota bacterium]
MKVLYVDHYDSFAYNVVHLLASQGANLDVVRSDDARLAPKLLERYEALVIGPGPGHPREVPRVLSAIAAAVESGMPVLGVCLGLQAIGEVLGARIEHAPRLMHGKTSRIEHTGTGVFKDLPSPLIATRYHSLALDPESLPAELTVTARSEDGVIQGIAHRERPVHAVQFHPESVLSEHGARLAHNFLEGI